MVLPVHSNPRRYQHLLHAFHALSYSYIDTRVSYLHPRALEVRHTRPKPRITRASTRVHKRRVRLRRSVRTTPACLVPRPMRVGGASVTLEAARRVPASPRTPPVHTTGWLLIATRYLHVRANETMDLAQNWCTCPPTPIGQALSSSNGSQASS